MVTLCLKAQLICKREWSNNINVLNQEKDIGKKASLTKVFFNKGNNKKSSLGGKKQFEEVRWANTLRQDYFLRQDVYSHNEYYTK